MANSPFLGEILLVPYNFPPQGYSFCQGQILSISQNTALFSLLGTTYGGDGKSNFALPDLQGNIPIHEGQGPGLELYDLGQTGGEQNVTLLVTEIPQHTHNVNCSGAPGGTTSPVNGVPARAGTGNTPYAPSGSSLTQQMSPNVAQPSGGSQPHNNMMPSLTLNWIIAMQGVFPSRS
jgi:microcystin-dependent protein